MKHSRGLAYATWMTLASANACITWSTCAWSSQSTTLTCLKLSRLDSRRLSWPQRGASWWPRRSLMMELTTSLTFWTSCASSTRPTSVSKDLSLTFSRIIRVTQINSFLTMSNSNSNIWWTIHKWTLITNHRSISLSRCNCKEWASAKVLYRCRPMTWVVSCKTWASTPTFLRC